MARTVRVDLWNLGIRRERERVRADARVCSGHTSGLPCVMSVQLVENEKRPMPSLLDPAPNRLRTNAWRPLSARHMIEIAVSSGNGYCGIHSQKKIAANCRRRS